jgi:protein strawberry notch
MANQTPKHGPDIPSQARLREALSQIAREIEDQPLRSSSLARIMRETFGGSDAGGVWSWRMAYDMMQAASVMQVLQGSDPDAITSAKMLATRLLTETRRSEQQIRLQQFSTPLPYAALVTCAAAIRPGETFLEPSAGTGALAGFALRAGGKPMLNEIDPFRRALLEAIFDAQVTGFDAEHIDDLLDVSDLPGVIVMNPPFASSVDRSRDKHIAAKHLIGAAKRLAPAGRLVAIMPMGFSPERDASHWARASAIAKPRLAITIPGHVYRKLGTTVETRLMVFDKVQEEVECVRVVVDDLDAARQIVDDIAATRPATPLIRANAQVRLTTRQGSSPAPHKRAVIPSGNERIYRVTPEGQGSMIGRTVSEDGAAALRARFMVGTPAANCMTSPNPARLQLRRKVWPKSRHFIASKKTCAACLPTNGSPLGKSAQNPSSTPSRFGWPKAAPVSRPNRQPERP